MKIIAPEGTNQVYTIDGALYKTDASGAVTVPDSNLMSLLSAGWRQGVLSNAISNFVNAGGSIPLNVQALGAKADGLTNDTAIIVAALALGIPLTSGGLTCAVSGNIRLPSGTRLFDIKFKQLDPNSSIRRTLYMQGGKDLWLERVTVYRNGSTTDGSIADAAGVWLTAVDDPTLIDVEVTGNGPGTGILLADCNRPKVIRPNIHDIQWSALSDPGIEQIVGLWYIRCKEIECQMPRIRNLTGKIGSNPVRAFQTDGLDFSGCTDANVLGGMIEYVGEGSDVSGSDPNRNIMFIGTHYKDCDSFGQKWAHNVQNSGSIGCRATGCGLMGWVITSGSIGDAAGIAHMRINQFTSINTGAAGTWAAFNVCGGGVVVGDGGPSLWPIDTVATDCISLDTGGTMKYGFRNETGVLASLILRNQVVSGATVADYLGYPY